jgi:hypothetical protein
MMMMMMMMMMKIIWNCIFQTFSFPYSAKISKEDAGDDDDAWDDEDNNINYAQTEASMAWMTEIGAGVASSSLSAGGELKGRWVIGLM